MGAACPAGWTDNANLDMCGQRGPGLGDCPDYVLCDLLRGRLPHDGCVLACLDLSQTGIVVTKGLAECFRGNIMLREIIPKDNNIPDAGIGGIGNLAIALLRTRTTERRCHALRRPLNLVLTVTARDTPGPWLEVRAHDLCVVCHDVAYAEPSTPFASLPKLHWCGLAGTGLIVKHHGGFAGEGRSVSETHGGRCSGAGLQGDSGVPKTPKQAS